MLYCKIMQTTLFRHVANCLLSACVICGRFTETTANMCASCHEQLPWITTACQRCGEQIAAGATGRLLCGKCVLSPPPFTFCKGIFHYQSPVAELLGGFKFNARFDAGLALGFVLAKRMQDYYCRHEPPDVFLPVPLHRTRLAVRGYNQALEIAKLAARQCHIPVARAIAKREKNTEAQTAIRGVAARQRNLRNAFVATASKLHDVKAVAIIDDVVTTTATVSALAKTLQKAGVQRTEVWCIARAIRLA